MCGPATAVLSANLVSLIFSDPVQVCKWTFLGHSISKSSAINTDGLQERFWHGIGLGALLSLAG